MVALNHGKQKTEREKKKNRTAISQTIFDMPNYSQVKHGVIEYDTNEDITKQYKKYQNSPKFNLNSEEIFCICRKPDLGGQLMIGCDGCNEWYHFKCMKVNELYKDLISKFYCKFCQWQGKGYTQWKRKCLVDDCWNPISIENGINSKYCSKQCGIKYFKTIMNGYSDRDKVKLLLNQCNGKDQFKQLGNKFPEFLDPNNLEILPTGIKDDLKMINNQIGELEKQIDASNKKIQYLLAYKEHMKLLNDKLNPGIKKTKRVELCLCNRKLRHVTPQMVDEFQSNIDSIIDDYNSDQVEFQGICLMERRKCPRHNGWFNLIHDQVIKAIAQDDAKLSELNGVKDLLIRDYSISVYEQKEKGEGVEGVERAGMV